MMYHNTPGSNGNQLAEKLRREYRNRGASLQGVSASSTEELMARAQMGRDPRVNVSEEAFAERMRRQNGGSSSAKGYTKNTQTRETAPNNRRTGERMNYRNTGARRTRPVQENEPELPRRKEIAVEKKHLSFTFLLLLSFVTLMVMMIILSIAQIYKTTDEISDLEKQLGTLQVTASELELKIEEKNDIRVIEQIATDRLGMVKEDSVQKKYISLSDGERIDIVTEETDEDMEDFGSMLSSVWTAFGEFFAGLK